LDIQKGCFGETAFFIRFNKKFCARDEAQDYLPHKSGLKERIEYNKDY